MLMSGIDPPHRRTKNYLAFYRRHYQELSEPLLALMRHGIRVDVTGARQLYATLREHCNKVAAHLDDLVGASTCVCSHHTNKHTPKTINIYKGVLRKDGKPRKPKLKTTHPCERCACNDFTPRFPSLIGKKGLSSQKVVRYLYDRTTGLGFPKQKLQGQTTGNEITIRKLTLRARNFTSPKRGPKASAPFWQRDPEHAIAVCQAILTHREWSKLSDYVNVTKFDIDDRVRCTYKTTTENGRLASSKNPLGTGYNLQNIPRPGGPSDPHTHIRKVFLPDDGMVLWECDFSQIEDRIVKVLSKVPEAIAEAGLHPDTFDSHSIGAQRIFSRVLGIPPEDVDVKVEVAPGTSRRQISKPIRHGINYDMSAARIQDTLLKDGVVLLLAMCKKLRAAGRERYVEIYQRERRKRIMRHHALVNSWGRRLDFHWCRLDGATYRRGYAFSAASENADCLNQLALIPLYYYIMDNNLQSRVNLQVHDSLVGSSPLGELWEILNFLNTVMSQVRVYEGVELGVPVEFKVGTTWMCELSYKRLPSPKALQADVENLLEGRG